MREVLLDRKKYRIWLIGVSINLILIFNLSCKTIENQSAYLMSASYGTSASKLFEQEDVSCQDARSGIEKVYVTKNYNEQTGGALSILTKSSHLYTGGEFKIDTFLSPEDSLDNIKLVASSSQAFAAVKKDGTLLSWGNKSFGGDSSGVKSQLKNIVYIKSTDSAFSVIKEDGSVVAWGRYGGIIPRSVQPKLKKVRKLVSNERAFVAMIRDKKISSKNKTRYKGHKYTYRLVSWGDPNFGGNSEEVDSLIESGVVDVVSSDRAFSAIKEDGSVVSWGDPEFGGDNSGVLDQLKDVIKIVPNQSAFVAIKEDKTLVAWGNPEHGGKLPSSSYLNDIKEVVSSWRAFTALRKDGRIVSWGSPYFGGDNSSLGKQVTGIKSICASESNFVALRRDGSVKVWGADNLINSYNDVSSNLEEGVKKIICSATSSVAVRGDGAIVGWSSLKDDDEYINNTISVDLKKIYPLSDDFLYVTKDGTISTLFYGGKKLGLSCSKK